MIKAGIMVPQFDIGQLGIYMAASVGQLQKERGDLDIIVFYKTWAKPPSLPTFCMMMEREICGFNGSLMATDIAGAQTLLRTAGPTRKYFYVWDLEWLARQQQYEWLESVYCNPDIELVARSESHAELIEKVWKKPIAVMEDFNKSVLT